jgi:hypothetical protein
VTLLTHISPVLIPGSRSTLVDVEALGTLSVPNNRQPNPRLTVSSRLNRTAQLLLLLLLLLPGLVLPATVAEQALRPDRSAAYRKSTPTMDVV